MAPSSNFPAIRDRAGPLNNPFKLNPAFVQATAMVAALGAGKFYGSSLPRPRFYTDVKLNGERIDPPLPVMDPLMAWAEEAHWSMGGVSTTRRRLQGRIEGNVSKLRETALFKKSGNRHKSVLFPSPAACDWIGG